MIARRLLEKRIAQGNLRPFSSLLAPTASQITNTTSGISQANLAAFHTLQAEHHLKPPLALHVQTLFRTKASLPRDPERPKLPLSAYFRFASVFREKNGLKGGVETMRKTGEAWSKLGDAEKKPFQDIASNDKKIYDKKLEEYRASGKLDAWKRDPAKPKRPNTAYLEWATERRKDPKLSALPMIECSKIIGSEWKSLPPAQKEALAAKAKTKMETYNKEMKIYKESGAEEAWLERTGRLAIKKKEEEKLLKRKTKEVAAKEKEKAAKEKEKEKAAKEKEKLKLKREKEKAAKEKEQLKLKGQKEKEAKAKEAAKKKAEMEKAKAKKAKEEAKKKADALKAKEKKAKEAPAKAKAGAKVAKAKEQSQVLSAGKK